jgi:hypothetical protein
MVNKRKREPERGRYVETYRDELGWVQTRVVYLSRVAAHLRKMDIMGRRRL